MHGMVFQERPKERTNVVNAVFPPPLGPTSKKVGRFVDAAVFWYRKVCSSIGRTRATTIVTRMVLRLGEKAAVSQLSSSCHAMTARLRTNKDWWTRKQLAGMLADKNSRGDVYVYVGAGDASCSA
jgi:hypothetical protein